MACPQQLWPKRIIFVNPMCAMKFPGHGLLSRLRGGACALGVGAIVMAL